MLIRLPLLRSCSTRATAAAVALLCCGHAAQAREDPAPEEPAPETSAADLANVEILPAFPGLEALRLRFEGDFVPAGGLEDGADVSVYRPDLRLRVAVPIGDRAGIQLVTRFGSAHYEFDGATDFFGTGLRSDDPFDPLFDAGIELQGSLLLNPGGSWLFEEERWSLLAALQGRARWESGAFSDGLTGGGGIALGYEIPRRLQLALGMSVGTRLAQSGANVGPIFSARWNVNDWLTLRSRERGAQVEVRLGPRLEAFAAGFITGKRWRLENRSDLPGGITFQDEQVRVGVGVEWKLSRRIRLNVESGVIAKRQLEVRVEGGDDLSDVDGDVAGYLGVRIDLRP